MHTHDVIVLLLPHIMEGFLTIDSKFYFFIEQAVNLQ